MNNKKLVSIVIPVYNRREEILNCLNSLKQIDYDNVETIIVDNGSIDNTQEAIQKDFSEVKILRNEQNLMATPARNQGYYVSHGDYILFLDSDNKVAPDFLTKMVELAESDPTIGFVGPKMYYGDTADTICYAGADINMLTSKTTYLGIDQIDRGQFDQVRSVQHIPNCSLVKREVIEKIGPWDASYIMSYEEPDFSVRAMNAGYKIMFCPQSRIWHNEKGVIRGIGFRSPKRAYYFAKNRAVFMKKYAKKLDFIVFLWLFFPLFFILHFFIFAKEKKWDILWGYWVGTRDGFIYGLTGKSIDSSAKLDQLEAHTKGRKSL
ncbi:MAG: glycosyltransferase family 2 protein [Patescibacteria group bacterium]